LTNGQKREWLTARQGSWEFEPVKRKKDKESKKFYSTVFYIPPIRMTLNYHEIYLSVEQKYWSTVGRKKATKTFVHWTKERLLRYLCLIRQTGFRVHQKTYLIPHTHTKSKWAITDTLKMQQLKQMKVSSNERNRRHRNSAPRVRLRQSESCHKLCNDFFFFRSGHCMPWVYRRSSVRIPAKV
jgi:hypothetical protein